MKTGSDLSKPGRRILGKVTASQKLMKMIVSYCPEYTDTLDWNADEKKMFQIATVSDKLSDKLFAVYLIARKLEGSASLDAPKIILPSG